MFGSHIRDNLYTEDETFVTGTDSFAQYATPLKRLPNTSVNDARQTVTQSQQHDAPQQSGEDSRAMRYKLFDSMNLVPLGNSALQVSRQSDNGVTSSLTNIPDLFSTKAELATTSSRMNNFQDRPDVPLFTGGPIMLEDFIPPKIQPRNRNPIVVTPHYNVNEDESIEAPSGEWTSPVIAEALRRQVNKEQQFKALWTNATRLFVFHMSLLLGENLYHLYQVTYHDENQIYRNTLWNLIYTLRSFQAIYPYIIASYAHVRDIQWLFLALIFFNIIALFRPQDQCKDLPLTNQQRELIGLQPKEEPTEAEGGDSDLIIKQRLFKETTSVPLLIPRYAQGNELSGYKRLVGNDDTEVAIALKDLLPTHKLRRS